jgi:hypothetical protein
MVIGLTTENLMRDAWQGNRFAVRRLQRRSDDPERVASKSWRPAANPSGMPSHSSGGNMQGDQLTNAKTLLKDLRSLRRAIFRMAEPGLFEEVDSLFSVAETQLNQLIARLRQPRRS